MTVLVIVEGVVLLVLIVLVAGLLRAYGSVLQRLHALDGGAGATAGGLGAGPATAAAPLDVPAGREEWQEAHDLTGVSPAGESMALRTVGVDTDTVLLFLSSGCATCATFWEELRYPQRVRLPQNVRLVVVAQGEEAESPAALAELAPPGVDVVCSTAAWDDYDVPGSPYVVLVAGRTGRVRGAGTGQSWQQVAQLLARASGDAAYLTGGPSLHKPRSDAEREAEVDRELLAAGILPGDPRLYETGEP